MRGLWRIQKLWDIEKTTHFLGVFCEGSVEKYRSYGTLSKTTHFLGVFCEGSIETYNIMGH